MRSKRVKVRTSQAHKGQPEYWLIRTTLALRIEWCRSRARAMRFSEEVELLNEEMRRVLAFLEWEACRWEERATERVWMQVPATTVDTTTSATMPVSPEGALNEGLRAYAQRQAAIRRKLFTRFSEQWHDVPTFIRSWNDRLGDHGTQSRPCYLTPVPPIELL